MFKEKKNRSQFLLSDKKLAFDIFYRIKNVNNIHSLKQEFKKIMKQHFLFIYYQVRVS